MHSDNQAQSFAQDLLKPGFPFSFRDKKNKLMKIHRKITEDKCINLMPTFEHAYNLCLEGKSEKAAKLISEIAGLLIAAENDLGPEYLVELEVRNQMPRMLSQIRRELKKSAPDLGEGDLQETTDSVNDSQKR
jgi:hypothetical protein